MGNYYLASVFIDDGLFDLTWSTSKRTATDSDKTNNSNESDKLWNILLTNSTLEHNNKNNKQKNKIISDKYYTRNKTMMGCLFYFRYFWNIETKRKRNKEK